MQAQVSEISGDDAAVTYYVAGYIGRCTVYLEEKSVLLIDPENIPSLGDVSEVKDLLLAMADRDGFSAPKLWECRSIRSCAAMTLFENNSFV